MLHAGGLDLATEPFAAPLRFLMTDLPARLDAYGDLMADGATVRQTLPTGV